MSWLFDGEHEINLKLEKGQIFSLSKAQYGSLAQISMAAFRWAGVEPCEIRLLREGGNGDVIPGCDVVLYGKRLVYTIRMQPKREGFCAPGERITEGRSTLFALPLDSKLGGPGVELHVHEFRPEAGDYTGAILAAIFTTKESHRSTNSNRRRNT